MSSSHRLGCTMRSAEIIGLYGVYLREAEHEVSLSGRATPSNKMTIACQWKIFYSASQRAMVASAVSHATANACRHFLTLAQRHLRTLALRQEADIGESASIQPPTGVIDRSVSTPDQ